jgi:cytochrome P450
MTFCLNLLIDSCSEVVLFSQLLMPNQPQPQMQSDRAGSAGYLSQVTAVLLVTAITILIANLLWTTREYHGRVRDAQKSGKDQPVPVPVIPYAIPGLGSTISFSTQKVGSYWRWLSAECKQKGINAVSILLNGKKTHLLFTPDGVSSAFKSRALTRFELDRQLGRNSLGMSKEDSVRAFPSDLDPKQSLTTERIHANMLLSTSAVNTLTDKFIEVFQERLHRVDASGDGIEINLYQWFREEAFYASVVSLGGTKLLEMFPDISSEFWTWDEGLVGMLFGTPRLFAHAAYAARDSLVDKLERWLAVGYASPVDESDPDWEPNFGARVMRKRHEYYAQQKMSLRGQASADLIFFGGILTNAIPSIGWMLMHILSPTNPPELRSWVMDEIESAQREDGSIDVPSLSKLPLINSMFHEVLRVYIDLLIVRQVDADTTIGPHVVYKNEMIMAPSWLSHRNPQHFAKPDAFDPARFLIDDPETGKVKFSTAGLTGKFFPFGGGHYMCPGRTFAKQEVLGAVAVLLLNFDIEFVKFVKPSGQDYISAGQGADGFPKLKNGFAGNVVVGLEGDMKIKMTKKKKQGL